MLTLLDRLSKCQYDAITRKIRTGVRITPSGAKQQGGLSRKAFKTLLAQTLGMPEQDKQLVLLCRKV